MSLSFAEAVEVDEAVKEYVPVTSFPLRLVFELLVWVLVDDATDPWFVSVWNAVVAVAPFEATE